MSSRDLDRGIASRSPRERVPLWSIGLTALLVVMGFGRRSRAAPSRIGTADPRFEGDRGRAANSPTEIPARGWKDIFLRVYGGISEDRILANAAAVTFYALLALFPGIAALVSIYGLFADPQSIAQHLDNRNCSRPRCGLGMRRRAEAS